MVYNCRLRVGDTDWDLVWRVAIAEEGQIRQPGLKHKPMRAASTEWECFPRSIEVIDRPALFIAYLESLFQWPLAFPEIYSILKFQDGGKCNPSGRLSYR